MDRNIECNIHTLLYYFDYKKLLSYHHCIHITIYISYILRPSNSIGSLFAARGTVTSPYLTFTDSGRSIRITFLILITSHSYTPQSSYCYSWLQLAISAYMY